MSYVRDFISTSDFSPLTTIQTSSWVNHNNHSFWKAYLDLQGNKENLQSISVPLSQKRKKTAVSGKDRQSGKQTTLTPSGITSNSPGFRLLTLEYQLQDRKTEPKNSVWNWDPWRELKMTLSKPCGSQQRQMQILWRKQSSLRSSFPLKI